MLWGLSPTEFDAAAAAQGSPGRWGSVVWFLARISPLVHNRAILVLPCLMLGFFTCAVMIELARARRYFPAELAMFALYTLSLSAQAYSFERYT